jgi:succinoglycan biosynthesis transport protein ExoP
VITGETSQESRAGVVSQALHYWHVLLRWKWTASIIFVIPVAAATIYSFVVSPVYTASGTIWIDEEPNILPFDEVQSLGVGSSLQSHARLIQSRTLASETIDELKLFNNLDFTGKPKKGEGPRNPADPIYREFLVQGFLANLNVFTSERTRLVDVRYSSRSPKLAAEILNTLFDKYIQMVVSKRYSASMKASEFLGTQIAEIRGEIEEKEKELNKYGAEKGIVPLTAAETPTVTRIADVNKALTDATIDRVNKYSRYNQLKAAPLGEIPDAPEGSLIQRLREQYVTLSRQYATRLATVRPEYPEMQRLKGELDAATEALQNETQNLIRVAYNEYEAALRQEQSLQNLLNSQKAEAYKANSSSVVYNSLKIELENRKSLLEILMKRQSETDVSSRLKGLEAMNVWVVDKADYPMKAFPNKRKNVLMGILIGLAAGIGFALGLEFLNNTVRTAQDVIKTTALPVLGSIPAFESETKPKGPIREISQIIRMFRPKGERKNSGGRRKGNDLAAGLFREPDFSNGNGTETHDQSGQIELIVQKEPNSIQSESYRSIRTTLLVSSPPGRIKTILFTSPLAKEGKSSTVSNLGIALAEGNRKVVIVDSDLRKPKLARLFRKSIATCPGLSRYLSSTMDAADLARSAMTNLDLITSGPLPANPIELLTSERMDGLVTFLKRNYDFVLFDTPPVLAVSDALAMGPMVDAIILVVRGGQTPMQAMTQAKHKLDAHRLKCLGVILNGVDLIAQDGYYATQYYNYSKAD